MKKERKIGLDILRIISMFGIVGLHVINQGGLINNAYIYNANYYSILILLVFFFTSVDVFGMLSGYLCIEKESNKHSRIIELIFIVIFYCMIIPTIYYLLNTNLLYIENAKNIIYNYFPILKGNYWYITSYVLLFFMIPYLNKVGKALTKKQYRNMLLILFILLSIIPNILLETIDLFKIELGYSPFWLIYCYLIGGYIKIYELDLKNKKLCCYFLSLFLVTFIINCLIRNVGYIIFGRVVKEYLLIDYISPFIICLSILLIIIFSRINISNNRIRKIVLFFSSTSFSVYLIHCHRVIFYNYLKDLFVPLLNYNFVIVFVAILLSITLIYVVCSLLDIIRKILFKLLKVDCLIDYIGEKLDKLLY